MCLCHHPACAESNPVLTGQRRDTGLGLETGWGDTNPKWRCQEAPWGQGESPLPPPQEHSMSSCPHQGFSCSACGCGSNGAQHLLLGQCCVHCRASVTPARGDCPNPPKQCKLSGKRQQRILICPGACWGQPVFAS